MLTDNITFVLGRITPVKYKHFGSNSFPNSVIRQYIVLLLRREWGTVELVTTDLLSHVGFGLDGSSQVPESLSDVYNLFSGCLGSNKL